MRTDLILRGRTLESRVIGVEAVAADAELLAIGPQRRGVAVFETPSYRTGGCIAGAGFSSYV
jgi:hypothetical protein